MSSIKIGMMVCVYNHEHIWHGQIGIIRGIRGEFFRIELLGKLIWMPKHWLTPIENGHD